MSHLQRHPRTGLISRPLAPRGKKILLYLQYYTENVHCRYRRQTIQHDILWRTKFHVEMLMSLNENENYCEAFSGVYGVARRNAICDTFPLFVVRYFPLPLARPWCSSAPSPCPPRGGPPPRPPSCTPPRSPRPARAWWRTRPR